MALDPLTRDARASGEIPDPDWNDPPDENEPAPDWNEPAPMFALGAETAIDSKPDEPEPDEIPDSNPDEIGPAEIGPAEIGAGANCCCSFCVLYLMK